jgi:hypothetical protein
MVPYVNRSTWFVAGCLVAVGRKGTTPVMPEPRNPGTGGANILQSFNPIRTRESRSSPPITTAPPNIFHLLASLYLGGYSEQPIAKTVILSTYIDCKKCLISSHETVDLQESLCHIDLGGRHMTLEVVQPRNANVELYHMRACICSGSTQPSPRSELFYAVASTVSCQLRHLVVFSRNRRI